MSDIELGDLCSVTDQELGALVRLVEGEGWKVFTEVLDRHETRLAKALLESGTAENLRDAQMFHCWLVKLQNLQQDIQVALNDSQNSKSEKTS